MALPGGHWLPEQAPDETYLALHPFFAERPKHTV
jgi:hypothetical protein